MAKIVLDNVASGYNLSKINKNFQRIADELQSKVLYRNNPGGEPNSLKTDLDMNSKNILNAGQVHAQSIMKDGVDYVVLIQGYAKDAEQSAVNSLASSLLSAASANAAATSAGNAKGYAESTAEYYALTDAIKTSLAGGTIGFDSPAYDFGSVATETTYFNRDFGSIA